MCHHRTARPAPATTDRTSNPARGRVVVKHPVPGAVTYTRNNETVTDHVTRHRWCVTPAPHFTPIPGEWLHATIPTLTTNGHPEPVG